MQYDLKYITDKYLAGEKIKFLFFWGHTEKGNEVTKACFSQWYPCSFEIGGITYHTAEQYMMAQKALLFQDESAYGGIMAAKHPGQFKELGRQVRNFSEAVWDRHKAGIVVEGNLAKFSQNSGLRDFLAQTGGRVLVEASPYDKIWGIGMSADNEKAQNPQLWNGQNLLGFALMEVRDRLAQK